MASHIIVAALVATVLAVFLLQVTAAPQGTTTPVSIEDALKSAHESRRKAFQVDKPKLDELLIKGQELFGTFTEEAGKIIPKTDEKPASA